MTAKELLTTYLDSKGVRQDDWGQYVWIDLSDEEHAFESKSDCGCWAEWACADMYRFHLDDIDEVDMPSIIDYFANPHNWSKTEG